MVISIADLLWGDAHTPSDDNGDEHFLLGLTTIHHPDGLVGRKD